MLSEQGVSTGMNAQFLRIRNRLINLNAISYVRLYDDLDRIDIRLLGPSHEVSLSVTVEGPEAAPVRAFFENQVPVTDLRPKE